MNKAEKMSGGRGGNIEWIEVKAVRKDSVTTTHFARQCYCFSLTIYDTPVNTFFFFSVILR